MKDGELNIFDTIINPEVGEEEKRKTKKKKLNEQINYEKEYEEARIKLQGLYNFDKYLKLDIATRLMSIYGVGMDRFNSFVYNGCNWFEIRYKHIEITIKETQKTPMERVLVIDKMYKIFDEKDSFLKFEIFND